MRLWHKSLISYLPQQQLLGQWRECCCIAKNIAEKGTPNHILVNRIMDYPIEHFYTYGCTVYMELYKRNYSADFNKFDKYFMPYNKHACTIMFPNWHNNKYLIQCLYNLEEKHDCKGINDTEWNILINGYKKITGGNWL